MHAFIASDGTRWRVWLVEPARFTGLVEADVLHDRTPWLCFQGPSERRRLQPVPRGWDRLRDSDLWQLCLSADRVDLHAESLLRRPGAPPVGPAAPGAAVALAAGAGGEPTAA